jgi:hypothetical protein
VILRTGWARGFGVWGSRGRSRPTSLRRTTVVVGAPGAAVQKWGLPQARVFATRA